MIDSEPRRLRRASGMSQTEFASAIGVSRETISRFERSAEPLDRRTELAMRYVAEGRLARFPELQEIHEAVAQVLDQTAVRGAPPYDYADRIRAAATHWMARRGSLIAEPLFRRVEGILGTLNVSPAGDPQRDRAMQDLLRLKQDWRTVAPAGRPSCDR